MKANNYKYFFTLAVFLLGFSVAKSQELNAKVTVISTRVSTKVDKKIFTTLQNQLTNLINNRKWTEEAFNQNEKIQCNFIVNINSELEDNVYSAALTVQASRPVYNSTYQSPLVNWQDNEVAFKYVEFQPVEFNENRIAGTDGLSSNLIANIAYYIQIILGMDYDSFSPNAGEPFYKKALMIVNNAPSGRNITGWTQFDGQRNKWWLAENLTSNKYGLIHDATYQYYRNVMDIFYENENDARVNMINVLNLLNTFNTNNQNSMVLQFWMQSKSNEIIQMLKNATPDLKTRAREILRKIDITNAAKYTEQLK